MIILKQPTQQVLDLLDELKTPYEKRAEEMSQTRCYWDCSVTCQITKMI